MSSVFSECGCGGDGLKWVECEVLWAGGDYVFCECEEGKRAELDMMREPTKTEEKHGRANIHALGPLRAP